MKRLLTSSVWIWFAGILTLLLAFLFFALPYYQEIQLQRALEIRGVYLGLDGMPNDGRIQALWLSPRGLLHGSSCDYDDSDVEQICQCFRKLDLLDVSCTQVSDSGLPHLLQLRHLQFLSLNHCNVTDAGMPILGQIRGLKSLRLIGTSITDEGITYLQALEQLEVLDLTDTGVSKQAAERLAMQLPNLDSVFTDTQPGAASGTYEECSADCDQ